MDEYVEKLHKVLLSIFVDFKEFCDKYDIKYCLAYGSAIGAVRHGGFIPWDDDLDIAMPIDEVDRFASLWEQYGNNEKYILKKIDRNSHINHMKLILRESEFMVPGEPEGMDGAFLDVMPIFKVKKNKTTSMTFWNAVRLVYTRRYVAENKGGAQYIASWCMLKLVPKCIQEKLYQHACKYVRKFQDCDMKDCYMVALQNLVDTRIYFDYDIFENLETIKFEGLDAKISSKNDELLKQNYGDYMKLPPEEEQICKHELTIRE